MYICFSGNSVFSSNNVRLRNPLRNMGNLAIFFRFSGAMVTTVSSRVFLSLFDEAQKNLEKKCYVEEESDSDDIPMALECACPECGHGPRCLT